MRDEGITDIVGTAILLGIVVTLGAVYALQLAEDAPPPATRLRLDVSARADDAAVTLVHVGGSTVDRGDIRVVVTAQGQAFVDAPAGGAGVLWTFGEDVVVPLPAPLPPGPAEVSLVHVPRGETLATAAIATQGAATPPSAPSFTLTVELDGSANPPTVVAPGQVLAEARADHDEGRKMVRHVSVDLSPVDGPHFVALRDDGTRGDVAAADGVWSAILTVPASSPKGTVTLRFTAADLKGAETSATADATVV